MRIEYYRRRPGEYWAVMMGPSYENAGYQDVLAAKRGKITNMGIRLSSLRDLELLTEAQARRFAPALFRADGEPRR